MKTFLGLSSAIAVGLGLGGASVGQAAERLACGTVVRQSIRLQSDITGCAGPGLIVGASRITIDLNGHTIGFNGGQDIVFPYRPKPFQEVTVENGTLRNTGEAIRGVADTSRFMHLEVFFVNIGIDISGRRNLHSFNRFHDLLDGVDIGDSGRDTGSTASNNTFANIGDAGVVTFDTETVIANNRFANGNHAILLDGLAARDTVSGNVATGFGGDGAIKVNAGSGHLLVGNNASGNSNDGILVVNGPDTTTLTRNTANDNGGHGIDAPNGAIDGGGNRASGNALSPQCVGVSCP